MNKQQALESLLADTVAAMAKEIMDTWPDEGRHILYTIMLSMFEKPLIEAVLKNTQGNQTEAAAILGINRGTLRRKMKYCGLIFSELQAV